MTRFSGHLLFENTSAISLHSIPEHRLMMDVALYEGPGFISLLRDSCVEFACLQVPVWLLSTVHRHPGRVMGDVKLEFCGCECEEHEGFGLSL